jgi:mRNA interferase RelE/StbE
MYKIGIPSRAERELKRLARPVQNRVVSAIMALASDPRPHGWLKVKSEEGVWRIRSGDWRAGYAEDDKANEILVVRHEKTVAPCAVTEPMARHREKILAEVRRRWQERDSTPLLPRFGDRPAWRSQPACNLGWRRKPQGFCDALRNPSKSQEGAGDERCAAGLAGRLRHGGGIIPYVRCGERAYPRCQ